MNNDVKAISFHFCFLFFNDDDLVLKAFSSVRCITSKSIKFSFYFRIPTQSFFFFNLLSLRIVSITILTYPFSYYDNVKLINDTHTHDEFIDGVFFSLEALRVNSFCI